jgi:hypothetical protein
MAEAEDAQGVHVRISAALALGGEGTKPGHLAPPTFGIYSGLHNKCTLLWHQQLQCYRYHVRDAPQKHHLSILDVCHHPFDAITQCLGLWLQLA